LALRTVRPTGTIALKSTVASDAGMNLAPVVIDEVRVVGSRCGPFPPALAAMAEGAIDPTPLIDETFELADGLAALDRATQPGVAKVLLKNKA
jgi:threonine dehydrogenase-like Zn-dependent dehydrogenase